jgi:hypothetical protein
MGLEEPRTQGQVREGMSVLLGWVVRTARCEVGCIVVTPQLTSAAAGRAESRKRSIYQNNAVTIYICHFCSYNTLT